MVERMERRVSHNELTHMILTCPVCGLEIVIDITKKEQVSRLTSLKEEFGCPACGRLFDSNLHASIRSFVSWYEDVEKSKQPVFLRIEEGKS
jgi:transcription elongation factor Elf1